MKVHIVGAGLAGSECAWQLVKRGIPVRIFEKKKIKKSPVYKSDYFAELVCSNSLKSTDLKNAEGLLKAELEVLDSLLIRIAKQTSVPAGKALAVDRELFSQKVTEELLKTGLVEVVETEVTEIPKDNDIWVIATGPTTDDGLFEWISKETGGMLNFFDAVAPIVSFESINMDICYFGDRYGVGRGDYINCPMSKEEYERFWNELVNAEVIEMKDFDRKLLFERCQPIEEIARSGINSLLFGPLRPVGLHNPKTGKEPYAVVQLRKENLAGTMYNLVGFQTRLKWGEQKRIIQLIPGLENAEIFRYGVMHRNTYVNANKSLDKYLRLKHRNNIFMAGQIVGVEGYVESIMAGLYVGINISRILTNKEPVTLPENTMCYGVLNYVLTAEDPKPMYANFGLVNIPKKKKREEFALEAIERMKEWSEKFAI